MDKNYFIDILFDLINESDALEAELLDICAGKDGLIVTIKDGSHFIIQVMDVDK